MSDHPVTVQGPVADGDTITLAVAPAPTTPTTPPPTTVKYPADGGLTLRAVPALARPAYNVPVAMSPLGTTIRRIGNIAGVRHSYARLSAFNADGSKILQGFAYPGRMIDGKTYADLGAFAQISSALWSNVDPNKLYGGNGGLLVAQNATTGVLTTIHSFAGYTSLTIGDYEGAVSDDDHYIVLVGYASSGKTLICYDLVANTILGTMPVPAGFDNAQMSHKGNYVVIVAGFGTRAYNRALTSYIQLTTTHNHGDNALDASGKEIYVGCNANEFGGTQVVAFDLASGARTTLLSGSAYEDGHVSGRNIDRPGWAYLSCYDNVAMAGRPGNDQVVAVKTDGSGTVEVFAFTHHTLADDNSTTAYARQPQATVSRDGSKVLFASEWDGGTSVFDYVAGV